MVFSIFFVDFNDLRAQTPPSWGDFERRPARSQEVLGPLGASFLWCFFYPVFLVIYCF